MTQIKLDQAKAGDIRAVEDVLGEYKSLVRMIARRYFLAGADFDDVMQEGMIGLFNGVQNYSSERGAFKNFAAVCIKRQILRAIKSATTKKYSVLTDSVRMDTMALAEVLQQDNPEDALIAKEEKEARFRAIYKILSSFERQVLTLYLEGLSYEEMAVSLKKVVKNIDNAITRIKIKLKTKFTG